MTETVFRLKQHLTSFQIMILGFAGVILLGALVLMLPIATVQRVWTPFHEALFTSTSAVCVTGLVVQDTGSYWSAFGQTVILLLIQIGGLGVITGAVTFLMLAGRNITLKERSAMQDAISAPAVGGIVRLTRFILKGTFLVELLGALALLPAFCRDYGLRGVWMSVFHSVSAFCNAGFSTLPGNLGNPLVMTGHNPFFIYISLLIILGGIGFPILVNFKDIILYHLRRLWHFLRTWHWDGKRFYHLYNLNTKIVLIVTFLLLVLGTVGIAVFEWNASSPACRWQTSGRRRFSMPRVPVRQALPVWTWQAWGYRRLLIYLFLMWVGGGSQSTGRRYQGKCLCGSGAESGGCVARHGTGRGVWP